MTRLGAEPLRRTAAALRSGDVRAMDLAERAIARHRASGAGPGAYKEFDASGARGMARRADEMLAASEAPPLCGIPVSVKDLYGVEGLPTYAGTARALPSGWTREGWLVSRLRAQGAVFTGKTHTVELAYGGVGLNPHWGTPRNPWDAEAHRIPGGSSSGAGVSLVEGSALIALGSDTGGSIRIPASMTGTVGARFTRGRWPTSGVVPLSSTMDTVGGLTRSVDDALWLFGAVDPAWGDPASLRDALLAGRSTFTVGVPRSEIWEDAQADIAGVLDAALDALLAAGWSRRDVDGGLLDEAGAAYMRGKLVSAECRAFLERELPGWIPLLDPTVAERIRGAPPLDSDAYREAVAVQRRLAGRAAGLFDGVDLLVLPGAVDTPARIETLRELDAYLATNARTLQPTCPVSMLDLCAITIPVGLDDAAMPVGLQLVAPGGDDEALLGAALAAERVLGTGHERLGAPP